MAIDFQSEEEALRKLRERLRSMSDEELIRFGKEVRRLAENPFQRQLEEARREWKQAALIKTGRRVEKSDVWGHNLVTLAHDLEKTGVGLPLGLLDDLQKFNDFFDELRYPHPARRVQDLSSLEGELLDSLVLRLHPFAEGIS